MKRIPVLTSFIMIVLFAFLAAGCGGAPAPTQAPEPAGGGSGDLLNTQVALVLTQTAIAQVPVIPTEAQPQPQPTIPPEPTLIPTVAPTAFPYPATHFNYEGVQFDLPNFIAGGAASVVEPAVVTEESGWPAELHPAYVNFDLEGYLLTDTFHRPQIRVYPVAEYQALSDWGAQRIQEFRDFMTSRPASVPYNTNLPMIIFWNAGQIFNSQFAYVDFQNGSGFRYISMYAQAIYPADNYNIFYTYQGMTSDGQYYVSAVLPIKSAVLPDNAPMPDDWQAFEAEFDQYLSQTSALLNGQMPDTFLPSLNAVDAMMGSFLITP